VLERVAEFLADGRAAGFAQHAHAMSQCAQPKVRSSMLNVKCFST
jgi:hypothetical protein